MNFLNRCRYLTLSFNCAKRTSSPGVGLMKIRNFRENSIFANSIKIHICDVRNSRVGHDLPTSVNDSGFAISRGFIFAKVLFSRNFAYAKFRENKPPRKFPNLQQIFTVLFSMGRVFNPRLLVIL